MNSKNKAEEKFAEEFAKLMIEKIESIDGDWSKPWFTTRSNGYPQSITGRRYNGMNSLMLYMLSEKMQYKTPVYMTFNQARNLNVSISKGEKSFPVIFWDFTIRDIKTREKISLEDYRILPDEEKANYITRPFLVHHNVFNVDQTNLGEVRPDLMRRIEEHFKVRELRDEKGLYAHPALDEMVEKQGWICKIESKESKNAFYSKKTDSIVVPLKGQFQEGEAFYATLLHEMAHSTGVASRLDRPHGKTFGDPEYTREELVAELTSAMICQSIGITTTVREENAAYIKNWLGSIKQSPDFLMDILSDVNKAHRFMLTELSKFDKSIDLGMDMPEESIKEKESKTLTEKPLAKEERIKHPARRRGLRV